MYQIIKIFGLDSHQLARLQEVLKNDAVTSKKQYWQIGDTGKKRWGYVRFAELLNSQCQRESDTYNVEIGIHLRVRVWTEIDILDIRKGEKEIYMPVRVLIAIHRALGERFLPEPTPTAPQ